MSPASTAELREFGKSARWNLSDVERAHLSNKIQRNFLRSALFFSASTIACYIASGDEVDTARVFEQAWRTRKRIFAPVIEGEGTMRFVEIRRDTRLLRNHYGIWEPANGIEIPAQKLDVVVAPTVAFDEDRHRIGMGGGYFDRVFGFLRFKKQWLRPKLAGFAFHCQKVEKITPKPWDIRLYRVFSDSESAIGRRIFANHL